MNKFIKTLSSKFLVILLFAVFTLPIAAAEKNKGMTYADNFCGIWKYETKYEGKSYLRIVKEGKGKFRFFTGYKYEGKIVWQDPMLKNASGIYLKPSDGKLKGKFISSNFYATHGKDFTYKITLELKSDNKLLYSVWSSIEGETVTAEATKISN